MDRTEVSLDQNLQLSCANNLAGEHKFYQRWKMEFEVKFYGIFKTCTWRVAGKGYIRIQLMYWTSQFLLFMAMATKCHMVLPHIYDKPTTAHF
jgi:hypothetical protein